MVTPTFTIIITATTMKSTINKHTCKHSLVFIPCHTNLALEWASSTYSLLQWTFYISCSAYQHHMVWHTPHTMCLSVRRAIIHMQLVFELTSQNKKWKAMVKGHTAQKKISELCEFEANHSSWESSSSRGRHRWDHNLQWCCHLGNQNSYNIVGGRGKSLVYETT